jgi:hypothetical protein
MGTAASRRGLALGNEVRSARATLKQAIRKNPAIALDVVRGRLAKWEETARNMTIEALLMAVPGVGPATVDELLDARGIPPGARVYALTDERREEIATAIERMEKP